MTVWIAEARAAQIRADLEHVYRRRPSIARSSLTVQLDDRALFLEALARTLRRGARAGSLTRRPQRGCRTRSARPMERTRSPRRCRLSAGARFSSAGRSARVLHADRTRAPPGTSLSLRDPRLHSKARCGASCSNGPFTCWRGAMRTWMPPRRSAAGRAASATILQRFAILHLGKSDAVRVAHPLSAAVPLLSRWLDMPTVWPAGGRHDMPRIQGPDYGASERFSVAPGQEQLGYFHMPGGQSGHPLSPFYRAGFSAWAEGRPTPLLPGDASHRLALMP